MGKNIVNEVYNMKYIIGIDGGGTKTEAYAYTLEGEVIAKGFSGYGNMLVNEEAAIQHIIEAIEACKSNLVDEKCVYIYIGLAGIDSGSHRKKLERRLEEYQLPFTIVNDVRIAHAAFFADEEGILTIAGTGSVSYGVKGEQMSMSGGWGHLLGDEGSGYWIAIEGFKQMIEEYERSKELSSLSQSLLKELKIKEISEIKSFIYGATKGDIAALVPIIVMEAENGNQEAQNILKNAGKSLGKMTLCLANKMTFENEFTIATKGSILTHISYVKESFMSYIQANNNKAIFNFKEESSTKGAYYLALKELEK